MRTLLRISVLACIGFALAGPARALPRDVLYTITSGSISPRFGIGTTLVGGEVSVPNARDPSLSAFATRAYAGTPVVKLVGTLGTLSRVLSYQRHYVYPNIFPVYTQNGTVASFTRGLRLRPSVLGQYAGSGLFLNANSRGTLLSGTLFRDFLVFTSDPYGYPITIRERHEATFVGREVPEPSSASMLGLGLVGLVLASVLPRCRRRWLGSRASGEPR